MHFILTTAIVFSNVSLMRISNQYQLFFWVGWLRHFLLQSYVESGLVSSSSVNERIQKDGQGISSQRSRRRRLRQKFIKSLNEGTLVGTQVHSSLAVSNAVELLKLVFLSTSGAPELQNHLAETLRRYSERDLFAAFSYLREKKIMVKHLFFNPSFCCRQF